MESLGSELSIKLKVCWVQAHIFSTKDNTEVIIPVLQFEAAAHGLNK